MEAEIKANIELADQYEDLKAQMKQMNRNWDAERKENDKLKQVMSIMLQNRRMLEEEVEYTHNRYKKMMQDKETEY